MNKAELHDIAVDFLADWDRQAWMQDHGTWASEEWDEVRAVEDDYIAEGRIDPGCVADDASSLGVGEAKDGWECREGWGLYRHGDSLVLRWWRDAWGNRHDRDLWVVIDAKFFAQELENAR